MPTSPTLTPAQRARLLGLFGLNGTPTPAALKAARRVRVRAIHAQNPAQPCTKALAAINTAYDLLAAPTLAPSLHATATPREKPEPRAITRTLTDGAYLAAAWRAIAHTTQAAVRATWQAVEQADPHAVRMGLPTRHLVQEPRLHYHVARQEIQCVGQPTRFVFPSALQHGRNVLILPNPAGGVVVHTHDHTPHTPEPVHIHPAAFARPVPIVFQNTEQPETFCPDQPLVSGPLALWGGTEAAVERAALDTRLAGTHTWTRPLRAHWHNIRYPHTPSIAA